MNTIDKADEAQLLATIDRWVEREVAPKVKEFDHADRWPAELVEQMKELGLFGATVSPDYGGLGLPARTYAEIVMCVSSVWMALTGIFNSHLMMAMLVEKFGTAEQKARFLPRMAAGELRGALGLTEPDAGTDLAAIRTRGATFATITHAAGISSTGDADRSSLVIVARLSTTAKHGFHHSRFVHFPWLEG